MKKNYYILGIILAISIASCDYVKNPKEINPSTNNPGTNSNVVIKKILLEDYTGHTCGNCPQAALKADEVHANYGSNVITLAVHAGFFAEPSASGTYTTDYRTSVGDAWDNFFGNSAAGNPNGMINRKDYASSTHIKNHNGWLSEISPLANQAADIKINIVPNYDASSRILNVDVKSKFLKALSDNYKLSVVLSEDSIVGPQKDYSLNPNTVYNYMFRHVLRGSLNGNFGDVLNNGSVNANDSITKSYSNYAVSSAFNHNRLYVVAFIYNINTYEIIQAEEIKIK